MARVLDLSGPLAKVERAAVHRKELHNQIVDFLNNASTYGVVSEPDPDFPGWRMIKFQVYAAPPVRLGVIVGDITHNLRSALDHLVYELAGRRGGGTQFPIFDSSERYLKPRECGASARDTMLKGVAASHRAIIDN